MDFLPSESFMVDLSGLSQEEWNALSQALGTVVVKWNLVEHLLDYCVAIIYHNCGGKSIVKQDKNKVPRFMESKANYLKNCLEKLDILLPYKDEGLLLVKRSSDLSKERNDMIHMRLMGKNPDGSFLFDKLDHKAMHESRMLPYTINQFHQFGTKILDLAEDLGQFCKRLQQQFVCP
ncbi:MAG: hypothetical protein A2Y80_05480 [Deltaproteobacteria bacterium RBG_13_58_19]|nr:MAG: hypothetical protein A2Y80_05480 [Deltaproteobacteria bacterium RBG_13_58_19]